MTGESSVRRTGAGVVGLVLAVCIAAIARSDNYVTRSSIGPAFASTASNATAFIHHSILTVGDQQFVTYYNENENVTVARRTLGTDVWDVYPTSFTAYNVHDAHDVISFGIDGAGYMHISWGMHCNPLLYAMSNAPVTGAGPIAFAGPIPMTGFEDTVTYPQFYELPSGDLLFLFREGTSGAGDTYWSRYDVASGAWNTVHGGDGQTPFFQGTGWTPDYNLYNNHAALDSLGTLHLTWTIRYNDDSPGGFSGFQTNHDIFYARSFDEASTWVRMDGTPYALPISEFGENGDPSTAAEVALTIPEGSSLINQCSMTIDNDDQPLFAMYWAPEAASGDHARQYMIGWYDGAAWHTSQITDYETDYDPDGDGINSRIPEWELGNYRMSRPAVLVDDEDRVFVVFSDYHRGQVVTAAWSEDRINWNFVDLTAEDAGLWEPTVDAEIWRRENKVHMLYHPMGRGSVQTAEVLEWDASEYIDNPPDPQPVPGPGDLLFADTFALALGDPNTQSGAYAPATYAAYGPGIDTSMGALRLNRWGTAGSSYVIPSADLGTPEVAAAGGYMVTLAGVDPVVNGDGTDTDWLGVSLFRPHTGEASTPVVLHSPYAMLIRDNGGSQVFESGELVREDVLDPWPPSSYTLRFVVEFRSVWGFGPARVSLYYGLANEPPGSLALIDVATLQNVSLPSQYIAIEARNERSTVDDLAVSMLVPGDVNLDGVVDTLDTDVLLNGMGAAGVRSDGDFTLDGIVDLADVYIVQQFFGFESGG